MADYDVGNIKIKSSVDSTGAVQGINKIMTALKGLESSFSDNASAKSINQLGNGLKKLSNINVGNLGNQMSGIVQKVSELSTKLNETESLSLTNTAKSLRSITNAVTGLEKIKNIDFRTLYNSMSSLTRILDPFLTKIKSSETSLLALAYSLKNLSTYKLSQATTAVNKFEVGATKSASAVDKISTKSELAALNITKMFDVSRIFLFYSYARRLVNVFTNMIQLAAAYEETMNKFQVSFGDLADSNIASINNLANAFGFSTATLLDYTATFNNMLSALGSLDSEMSASISQTLTRMAIDYASLFNVSLNSAMTAFQSVLAGSIRPIRETSGFDVSETSIYDVYLGLGGTKTMRELDQVEKRLLRIIALQQQMMATGAEGDFARTIDSVANSIKIIQEQLIELGTWMGKVFLVEIKTVLHYFAAILTVATNVVKAFAQLRTDEDGFDYDTEFAGFESANDSADDLLDTLTDIETTLLGFDKLNVLGSADDAYSYDIDDAILDGLSSYEIYLDNIDSTVKNISNGIMEWLGYTEEIRQVTDDLGNEYEETVWVLSEGITNMAKIVDGVKAFASVLVGAKIVTIIVGIVKGLGSAVTAIKAIGVALTAIGAPIILVVAAVAGLIAYMVYLYKTNESFATSINGIFTKVVTAIETMIEKIKPSLASIYETIVSLVLVIKTMVDNAMPTIVVILEEASKLFEVWVTKYIPAILDMWAEIGEEVVDIIKFLEPFLIILLDTVSNLIVKLTPFLSWLINNVLTTIISAISVVISSTKILIALFTFDFKTVINETIGLIQDLFEFLKNIGAVIIVSLGTIFSSIQVIVSSIGQMIYDAFTVVFDNIIKGFVNGIITAVNWVISKLNALGSIDIPSWLGGGTLTLFDFPSIPQLASGGVLSENSIVNVAEYAGASTNPEIVAPQSILKETFQESMLPMINALLTSNNGIKQAIQESGNRSIYMDSRKVGEELYEPLKQMAKVKGTSTTTL